MSFVLDAMLITGEHPTLATAQFMRKGAGKVLSLKAGTGSILCAELLGLLKGHHKVYDATAENDVVVVKHFGEFTHQDFASAVRSAVENLRKVRQLSGISVIA